MVSGGGAKLDEYTGGMAPEVVNVLENLLRERRPVTVEALALRCGVSPDRAAGALADLREAGCVLDEHPQHGVLLRASGLQCWADYLESRYRDRVGRRVDVYRQTASTQDVALRLARGVERADACHGTVVLADEQTAGRGRLGRRWSDQAGAAVLMSVVIDPAGHSGDHWMLAACVGLTLAIERVGVSGARIKWPNDILVGDRKLAGMLIETAACHAGHALIIGIGLNVAPVHLPHDPARPISLHECGCRTDRLAVIDSVLNSLNTLIKANAPAEWRSIWRDRSMLLQKTIAVRHDGRRVVGRVVDLDPDEGLLLALERGQVVALPAATSTIERVEG